MQFGTADYTGTDDDLAVRVTSYLHDRHLPTLRRLKVTASNGTVILEGRVDSFHEKQVAISSCRRVAGVRQLVDRMEVNG